MDWKNAHFNGESIFQAPCEIVLEATRAMAKNALATWSAREISGGMSYSGSSAMHHATAQFFVTSAASRTRVTIELLVERAGIGGFMLFDVGGYYDGQVRKWLWAIWNELDVIHATRPWDGGHANAPPQGSFAPNPQVGARVGVIDREGNHHLGIVRRVNQQQVLVEFESGGEAWFHAVEVHAV